MSNGHKRLRRHQKRHGGTSGGNPQPNAKDANGKQNHGSPPIDIGEFAEEQCRRRTCKCGQCDQPREERHAIKLGDHARLGNVSGVGKKQADKLCNKNCPHTNCDPSLEFLVLQKGMILHLIHKNVPTIQIKNESPLRFCSVRERYF